LSLRFNSIHSAQFSNGPASLSKPSASMDFEQHLQAHLHHIGWVARSALVMACSANGMTLDLVFSSSVFTTKRSLRAAPKAAVLRLRLVWVPPG
jgi:hypothetical protein